MMLTRNYLYDVNKQGFETFFNYPYLKKGEPFVRIVKNGIISPNDDNVMEGIDFDIDMSVVYMGNFTSGHYGLCLIDYLSRLWYNIESNIGIQIAYSAAFSIVDREDFLHILSLIGIDSEQLIKIDHPVSFKEVIVPDKSFLHGVYVYEKFLGVYENIYRNMRVPELGESHEKIYLTRRRLKRHKEIGEKVFEQFFNNNGFHVVAMEEHTLEEQAYVIRNARIIASIEGTHAHNIVFKGLSYRPYYQIILRKQSECIPRQIQLNQVTGGNTIWIDVWKEPFKRFPITHDRGPFLLEWNDLMDKFAMDNNYLVPNVSKMTKGVNRIDYFIKCLLYFSKHIIKRILCLKLLRPFYL